MTRVVKTIVIGLTVAYVLELFLQNVMKLPVVELLALMPSAPLPWQPLTYVLVDHPSSPFGFLIGMVFLWWILSPFEKAFGPRRTLQMCLACTLAAALPVIMLGMIVPASPALYGAHPLWFGAMAGHADTLRGRRMSLFGMGSMTAQQFLLLMVGLSALMYLASLNHTQLVGNLASMAGGIAFVRWMRRPRTPPRIRRRKKSGGFRVVQGGKGDDEPPTWLN